MLLKINELPVGEIGTAKTAFTIETKGLILRLVQNQTHVLVCLHHLPMLL